MNVTLQIHISTSQCKIANFFAFCKLEQIEKSLMYGFFWTPSHKGEVWYNASLLATHSLSARRYGVICLLFKLPRLSGDGNKLCYSGRGDWIHA